jgi:hypothetical protein
VLRCHWLDPRLVACDYSMIVAKPQNQI